jgi:hypothetical protein
MVNDASTMQSENEKRKAASMRLNADETVYDLEILAESRCAVKA